MVKEELIIGDQRVELLKSLNPNLTFNISDIANPDKRKSDFSKTITLPASKTINKIFEHLFEVNLALQTFNPNLKTDVIYLVDGEMNLDGYLQLKQINVTNKDDITYEVTLTGRVGDFISEISNSLLTDLDFSSLNHVYNGTNQIATWVTPANINVLGYVYPMINYHINYPSGVGTGSGGGQAWTEEWSVTDFFPCCFHFWCCFFIATEPYPFPLYRGQISRRLMFTSVFVFQSLQTQSLWGFVSQSI